MPENYDQIELETLELYKRLYREGKYEELCKQYCHESFTCYYSHATNRYEGGVCSIQTFGTSQQEVLQKTADLINLAVTTKDSLGC